MALLFALLPAACIDDGGYDPAPSYGPVYCGQFTSCASCTPVLGCGWCSMGSKGACVDQPNACANVASFSWTWELDGCPAAGDTGTADGGADAGTTD
jgi:hypothetical protein